MNTVRSHYYWKQVAAFKRELQAAIPHAELRALHVRRPAVHLAYGARQFGIVALCSFALWHVGTPQEPPARVEERAPGAPAAA